MLPWNNNTRRQVTDFIQGGIIIINYDISLLQLLLYKNIVNLGECVAAIVII